MKPRNRPSDDPDMLPEYDFSSGLRGRHAASFRAGTKVVVLDPDVAAAFGDSDAVNRALRLLIDVARTGAITPSKGKKEGRPSPGAASRTERS